MLKEGARSKVSGQMVYQPNVDTGLGQGRCSNPELGDLGAARDERERNERSSL